MALAERWLPKSFLALRHYTVQDFGADLLAGLTVVAADAGKIESRIQNEATATVMRILVFMAFFDFYFSEQ